MTTRSIGLARALPILLAIAVVPPVHASWSMQGATEPDTPEDASHGRMFLEPDADPDPSLRKVYFHAIAVDPAGFTPYGDVNPNLATRESRLAPVGELSAIAFLGFWKDCNEDGFIGMGDGALWDYRSELLSSAAICPETSPHHSLGWVTEFQWIAPYDRIYGEQPRLFEDADSRVWGDIGRPLDVADVPCPTHPLRKGTTESTGGLLWHVDCRTGHAMARHASALDADGSLGLRFEDPEDPGSDCASRLNQPVPGGTYGRNPCRPDDAGTLERNSGQPAFSTWDCSDRSGIRDPTEAAGGEGVVAPTYREARAATAVINMSGGTNIYGHEVVNFSDMRLDDGNGSYLVHPALSPRVHDPDGSYLDAAIGVLAPLVFRCESFKNVSAYYVEDDGDGVPGAEGKRWTDFSFEYFGDSTHEPGFGIDSPATRGTPEYLGVEAANLLLGQGWKTWDSKRFPEYSGNTVREDLQPAGAFFTTFYARLGSGTLTLATLPTTTAAAYGADVCQGAESGVRGSWDCDASRWWRPDLGGKEEPEYGGERPGSLYHLRDTDCYDGAIMEGIHASAASWSNEGTCEPRPS